MDNVFDTQEGPQQSMEASTHFNSSCRFDEEFKYILLPVSYSLVFVFGLMLNCMALWMFITRMRPWNTSTVFMFHLSLSDFLYVLSLPTLIYYYANRSHWPFGVFACKSVRFLFYANLYCSILLLTCISVHRYVGICHPIKARRLVKPRHAHLVCGLVWATVVICLVPNLIFVTTSPRGNDTLCHDTTSHEFFDEYVDYSSVVMVLLFGVPFLVIMVCYGLMARTLCRPRKGLSQSGQVASSSSSSLSSAHRKSIKMIVVVLVVFAVCFVPFHVTRTLYYTARVLHLDCTVLNIVNFSYKITRPLASVNSCIDPILYFLAGDQYRTKLMAALMGKRRVITSSHSGALAARDRRNKAAGPALPLAFKNTDAKAGGQEVET